MLNDKQQQLFNRVCERIANGESLVSICKDKSTPGYSTVMSWLSEDETGEVRTRAREKAKPTTSPTSCWQRPATSLTFNALPTSTRARCRCKLTR